ncbi:hypothetical protein D9M69_445600 [compost metagenome]
MRVGQCQGLFDLWAECHERLFQRGSDRRIGSSGLGEGPIHLLEAGECLGRQPHQGALLLGQNPPLHQIQSTETSQLAEQLGGLRHFDQHGAHQRVGFQNRIQSQFEMIEQGILDQQAGGNKLRMPLQALPGLKGALAHLPGQGMPLLTHLAPGGQKLRLDLRLVQGPLTRLESPFQFILGGLPGRLQIARATQHCRRQVAMPLGELDHLQQLLNRANAAQLLVGLATVLQRGEHVQHCRHADQDQGQRSKQGELAGETQAIKGFHRKTPGACWANATRSPRCRFLVNCYPLLET